jgi:hypothetical protein
MTGCEQFRHLHLGQRLDDLEHIPTGAEVAAGASDDDRLDGWFDRQGAECVAQFGVGIEGERVLSLWPIQRDGRDLFGNIQTEMHGGLQRHVTSLRKRPQSPGQ